MVNLKVSQNVQSEICYYDTHWAYSKTTVQKTIFFKNITGQGNLTIEF